MNILQSILPSEAPMEIGTFVLLLCIAAVLGVLNVLVLNLRSRHSAGFSLTLILLPVAVCVVIMLVNDRLGAGIAIAGAFSLVRFRSYPGTAREIISIFLCVVLGAALGMGYVAVAVLLFLFSAAICLVFTFLPAFSREGVHRQLRITIPENMDYNGLFDPVFSSFGIKGELLRIKSSAMGTMFELTYDITLPSVNVPKEFLDELRLINHNQTILIGLLPENDLL